MMTQFGQHLKSIRIECGLSQAIIANRLKVTKGYISRLESGKARPAESTLRSIASLCNADPTPLLILAGYLPGDIGEILKQYPNKAPSVLREAFGKGEYAMDKQTEFQTMVAEPQAIYQTNKTTYELILGDCFEHMESQLQANSIHAIITDPPYGLKEYTDTEKTKLRSGHGGVWRIPPAMNGCVRRPLPRFTILSNDEKLNLMVFFRKWGEYANRILVPGGHIFIATNPLLSQYVYMSLIEAGFEKRGEIIRLVQTLRGGDRPKNAHNEFKDVTVMPRSCWEPWGLFRKPCEGRVQDNLRKWKAGGLRRFGKDRPFCDVIRSSPTRSAEREIAPHPSLKPQGFMREIVRAALPLGEGIILDPFMGAGSTIAAASAIGYNSVGIERDAEFYAIARESIPKLAAVKLHGQSVHLGSHQISENDEQPTLFNF